MKNQEKIFLLLSLVGINIIFMISLVISPKEYKISEIQNLRENTLVKINGEIIKIKDYDGFQVLTLKEKNFSIDVTAENIGNEFLNKKVIVEGRVKEYKLKNQVVANKISPS